MSEKKTKRDSSKVYREPRIYKVSEGTTIYYLNEPMIQTPEVQKKIKEDKLKVIEKFRNVAGGGNK